MPEANVNTPSARYLTLEASRVRCRDLMEGIETLKRKCATYLPRNAAELPVQVAGGGTVDPWKDRVEYSRLTNLFAGAVDECAGRVYAKPIKVEDGTPAALEEFLDDVDGMGATLDTFGLAVMARSVAEGNDFVMVDYPRVPAGSTLLAKDEAALRIAPYWTRYSPETVIDWQFEKFGKEQRLAVVRLRESATVPDGRWGKRSVAQVRVLYAGNPLEDDKGDASPRWARWEVWQAVKADEPQGEWAIVPGGYGSMKPQVDIPLVEFPTDLTAPFEAIPPFLDLAYLTIAHYRKLSALDNAQHAVGFPIFHWAGAQTDATGAIVGLGPRNFLTAPDPAAHAEFVEPEGKAWASLRTELDAMEREGKALASEPFKSTGALTATGEAIRAAGAHSKLLGWVAAHENAFGSLLYYTAILMGLVDYDADKGWGGVELNRKFIPVAQNVDGARVMLDGNLAGKVSDESLFEALQRADLQSEALTFEEERERLSSQGPSEPTDEDRSGEDLTADPPDQVPPAVPPATEKEAV